ncbi:MAG: SusE domain-containing protein [Cyclobacteriaceae bacterium]
MKKILYILSVITLFMASACEDENSLEFIARPDADGIAFTNSFLSEYRLSEETAGNVAERFVWTPADHDTPVNVTYELQASIDPAFGAFEVVGSTSETNIAVLVDQMIEFAGELGLDDDPATTTEAGAPNNSGQIYFRLRAFTGTGAANVLETFSEIQPLNIVVIERQPVGGGCDPWFVVGEGAVDAGWNWDSPVMFSCDNSVYSTQINLTNAGNGSFRFFTTEGDWASGLNYPYFVDEGYTIDPLLVNAEDGDNNFKFTGTPGVYEMVIDDNAKTITLNEVGPLYIVGAGVPAAGWGWDTPVVMNVTGAYTWSATTEFANDAFRFFTTEGDWNSGLNFPYYEGEGYTIDTDLENAADDDSNFNFVGTAGTYTITLNTQDKTITVE